MKIGTEKEYTIKLSADQKIELNYYDNKPDKHIANYCFSITTGQIFSRKAIHSCLMQLVQEQPALRLIFPKSLRPDHGIVLPIHEIQTEFYYEEIDNKIDKESYLHQTLNSSISQAFQLESSPCIRFVAFKLSNKTMQLSVIMHHIICDVRSFVVFYNELLSKLIGKIQLQRAITPFNKLQQKYSSPTINPPVINFWQQQCSIGPPARLHFDGSSVTINTNILPCKLIYKPLVKEIYTRLKNKIENIEVGFSAIFLSAFQLAYAEYSQSNAFLIGMPFDFSGVPGLNSIGYFAAQRPIGYKQEDNISFMQLCINNEVQLQKVRNNYYCDLQELNFSTQDINTICRLPIIFSFVRLMPTINADGLNVTIHPPLKPETERDIQVTLIWNPKQQQLSIQALTLDSQDSFQQAQKLIELFMSKLYNITELIMLPRQTCMNAV